MEGINPVETPSIYDFVVLGAEVTPGIAEVTGFDRPYKWDAKEPKGSSGAETRYQGKGLVKGKIRIKLWLPEHFAAWDAMKAKISPPEGAKSPEALGILHPVPNDNEVFSVVIEKIGGVTAIGSKGLHAVDIELLEYRKPKPSGGSPKPKPATGSPDGSGGGGDGAGEDASGVNSVLEQQEAEIEALLAEAEEP